VADNYDDYSKEELIRELRAKNQKPRFGLYWERDDIEHERAINTDFVALDLDESLSCGDAPYANLIIEGDNFDTLRYLRMTYKGQVKCIYIDPPYNTGNKDFVYNDRFIDKDDVYKHSKWLEFMYRRLELARDLLAEDALICVSIDDNEIGNLLLLMDMIFGSSNRLACAPWLAEPSGGKEKTGLRGGHEYLLIYYIGNKSCISSEERSTGKLDKKDRLGAYRKGRELRKWGGTSLRNDRPKQWFPLTTPTGEIVYPYRNDGKEGHWRWGKDQKMKEIVINPELAHWEMCSYDNGVIVNNETERWVPFEKIRDSKKTVGWGTWLDSVGFNSDATRELKEIFGEKPFDTPKPSSLIEWLLRLHEDENALVLDFFAGSGTTAHAVLKLNAEDGGNRRFILVSNTEATESEPDKNLCRDVCAERVRRVMQGYTNQKTEQVEGLGSNFAYLKTRRIASEILLTEIEHTQIWTALQLSHGAALSAFNPNSSVQQLQTENDVVMYLCKLTEQELTAVTDCLQTLQTVVVYCWQPALLTQYIEDENLTCLPIPQILIERFGTGVKA
jgi:adenine-specific DNA-methyltransferase